MEKLLEEYKGNDIVILLGEGEVGTYKEYTGKPSALAIKRKLTAERCGGDKWAKAYIYAYDNDNRHVYINLENPSDMRHI